MTKTPGVPALASDIRRGYLALGIGFSSFIVMTVLLLFTDQNFTSESYIAASFFLYWAFASVLTVLITWLVFRKASAAELKRWKSPTVTDAKAAEDANLLVVARAVVASALAREESRGGHYRTDFPTTDPAQARHSAIAAGSPDA